MVSRYKLVQSVPTDGKNSRLDTDDQQNIDHKEGSNLYYEKSGWEIEPCWIYLTNMEVFPKQITKTLTAL